VAKQRSPNRDRAYQIYVEHNGRITSQEIAELLNEKINNINSWRVQDRWSKRLNKVGAPFGNQNAVGNVGGGAPQGNVNSFKYGNYSKRIPLAVKNIMEELDIEDPLEKLWRSICLQEARIIHMQEIMHVESKFDMTKEVKKTIDGESTAGVEYEIQFAWDKEANLVSTQSRAIATLAKMIKQYDEMLHANWDVATDEQKLRVEKIKIHVEEIKNKKEHAEKKLALEREKFEHQKDIDSKRYW
jgi:phage terminase small subunit